MTNNATVSTEALTEGICKKYEKKEYFSIHYLPRSQAIYGSSVETFGPYSQYYTTQTILK
jgi:hypothetical protein